MPKKPKAKAEKTPGLRPKGRLSLTVEEILELDSALAQVFQTIRELREKKPAAKLIKFPPVPAFFSESIVILSVNELFGPGWNARFGGTKCDVLIENAEGLTQKIEVKATGEHSFQEFKKKDLQADVLVWLCFGRRYHDDSGSIQILLLRQPGLQLDGPCRLDTERLKRRIKSQDSLRELNFNSLEELLGQNRLGGAMSPDRGGGR